MRRTARRPAPSAGRSAWRRDPTQFDMDALPKDFSIADTPLDLDVLRRPMARVREQLPALHEAPVRVHRGGFPR